jgi:hypothetical protein
MAVCWDATGGRLFPALQVTIIEAVYFSAVTITTVRYGDITATKPLSQLACMYELAVGFVLIIFALASYLATSAMRAVQSALQGAKPIDRRALVGRPTDTAPLLSGRPVKTS